VTSCSCLPGKGDLHHGKPDPLAIVGGDGILG
jgi:hypothetical protein